MDTCLSYRRASLIVCMAGVMAIVLMGARTSHAAVYEVPLFLRADDPTQESVLRLQSVYPRELKFQRLQIIGYDDTGTMHGPVWLTVETLNPLTLTAVDLEQGHTDKGLPVGLGTGEGDWRLLLIADDDFLDVRAYARDRARGQMVPLHALETAHERRRIRPGISQLHIVDVFAFKAEDDAPVCLHRHRPTLFQFVLEGVQPIVGKTHGSIFPPVRWKSRQMSAWMGEESRFINVRT